MSTIFANRLIGSTSLAIVAAAALLTSAAFISPKVPLVGSLAASPAQAGEMMGGMRGDGGMMGGGLGAGLAAGLVGGLLIGAVSHSYIEDPSDGRREDCYKFCGVHIHTSNIPGAKPIELVKRPRLHRVGCAGGRCAPVRYGNFNLWPYQDANRNNFAQITDQNGNPVNTGAPGGQINGYTIIR